MANEAEVDLVVNAAGALPDLERQLTRIIDAVEAGADEIDVQATLGVQEAIDTISGELDRVIAAVDRDNPTVDVETALDLQASLRNLREDVDQVSRDINSGLVDPLQLTAGLDFAESLQDITRDLQFLAEDAERSVQIEVQAELDEERLREFRESLDDLERSEKKVGDTSNKTGKALRFLALGIAGVPAAAGAAVNALTGVVLAIQQLGPAAAVGTSAILTQKLALGTLKLALVGVQDGIKNVFDQDLTASEFHKSIEGLAPEARLFVDGIHTIRRELRAVQQDVQNRVFKNLDDDLRSLTTALGPTITTALRGTADSFNAMARNAAQAALQLGKQGVLGTALEGATSALSNLEKVPARAVRSFGFLAAASAPALNRISLAVDKVSLDVQTKLQRAFESGALEKSIDQAVATFAQLGRALGNFGGGLKNIFDVVGQSGGGLFSILEKVSQAFEDVTATKGFQDALRAVSATASVVANTVLPLLSQAIQALGPIFTILAPPIQSLVKVIGGALGKVLTALAPVLESVARAIGKLIPVFTPVIELAGTLLSAILPALIPVFDAFGQVFEAVAPFVKIVADTIGMFLAPILKQLGPIVTAFLTPFVALYQTIFPKLTEIVAQLQPFFVRLGEALGRVAELAGPVIQKFIEMGLKLAGDLLPSIQPIIDGFLTLAEGALTALTTVLEEFVIPALEILTKLLNGDVVGAFKQSDEIVQNFKITVGKAFLDLRNKAVGIFNDLALKVVNAAQDMKEGFIEWVNGLIADAVTSFNELPGDIASAVGDLGSLLFDAGADLINGLVAGLDSKTGGLLSRAASIASSIVSTINGALDIHSPSRKTRKTGENIVKGLEKGMLDRIPNLKKVAEGVAKATGGQFGAPRGVSPTVSRVGMPTTTGLGTNVVNVYIGNQLVQQIVNDRLRSFMTQRDRAFVQGVRL